MEKTLYRKATTFKNLVCLNIAFLKGILTKTPYHGAPIAEETIPLLSQLVQLHKKGFLSTQGQPGVIENSFNENIQHQQKSYITGYMHNTLSGKLQSFIEGKPFYMVIIKNKKTVYNSLPPGKYNLTRVIHVDDPKKNEYFTNILKDKHYPYLEFEGYTVNSLLKKDYVFVEVYSTVYGEGYSCEKLLLDFFKSIPESVDIDTEFNPKLLNVDDKLLYLIAVKRLNALDDNEFNILKRLVFSRNCKQFNKDKLKALSKKVNKLNSNLKVNYINCLSDQAEKQDKYSESSLKKLTVVQLKSLALKLNCKGKVKNKSELIQLIISCKPKSSLRSPPKTSPRSPSPKVNVTLSPVHNNKTVVQLKKLAKDLGLKGYSKLNKAQLINFINLNR